MSSYKLQDVFINNSGEVIAYGYVISCCLAVTFEQIHVIHALPKLFVASFTLVLPSFPLGTSERKEDEGDIATSFTFARLLSNKSISRGGLINLVAFNIHALKVYN
ncbi:ribose-phosphate pyrophosphokinase [Medicago truncatula]|uniref:Ribose-phosphate pyrophosphokinase n=1 Tax=Medicago truncatula TaxID=3880 RepID=A0A072UGJ2_MEDTR|nr:ribose-phosphate pyrophosphokinase [Medicago truncatula]